MWTTSNLEINLNNITLFFPKGLSTKLSLKKTSTWYWKYHAIWTGFMFKSLHFSWYDTFCILSSFRLRFFSLDIIVITSFHLKCAQDNVKKCWQTKLFYYCQNFIQKFIPISWDTFYRGHKIKCLIWSNKLFDYFFKVLTMYACSYMSRYQILHSNVNLTIQAWLLQNWLGKKYNMNPMKIAECSSKSADWNIYLEKEV